MTLKRQSSKTNIETRLYNQVYAVSLIVVNHVIQYFEGLKLTFLGVYRYQCHRPLLFSHPEVLAH